jgi:hypothetical protein
MEAKMEKKGQSMLSLMMEDEIIDECKLKGWHYREIFLAGMEQKRGMPQILTRLNEAEAGNAKLSRAYAALWNRVQDLEKVKMEGL